MNERHEMDRTCPGCGHAPIYMENVGPDHRVLGCEKCGMRLEGHVDDDGMAVFRFPVKDSGDES